MTGDSTPPARPVVTGLGVLSACGRGLAPLAEATVHGKPAFGAVTRFDVSARRTGRAALLPDAPPLAQAVLTVVGDACRQSGTDGAGTPLLLALHSDLGTAEAVARVADGARRRWGFPGVTRVYTGACVAAGTAVADAAAMVCAGPHRRVVVAAGHLVQPGVFAAFDAGRALSRDGEVRPFSAGRSGTLLGDAAAAVVLERSDDAARRSVPALARIAGWGRSGDAHHVCRPAPDGGGLARAVAAALARAGIAPEEVGYVNANATGSPLADQAEANALRLVFGEFTGRLPVSSTKGVHGHALEASALLELAVTIAALREGTLPVNAGWAGPDEDCRLDLVLDQPRTGRPRYALSLNSAFGGANTALLVAA
ncbi:beta-ketoacyl-[acyl-carrier-protein] synthase family protein [Streptacidiphilus sp. PB12-B1b]|uniref:beta-ketoacyl synthase N-terminal-like domain-containing protein n=1 Tax=Streptacidiphilus sp. PB12-B1b TaxID=2705012 RepID=UPI0015FBE33C|nr:beta-ketoacyl synthase N-terminal-like domain-containing protein [Streptacidiphilus sp. PB12-B1b]QMU76563.1 beta-ketoacyl-[acyl-carrier-protein] synthase family protein [Streptacidiphilus sp. PB12-B1b]